MKKVTENKKYERVYFIFYCKYLIMNACVNTR